MTAPKRFRIFSAGLNTGTKGQVLFDEQAANDVMAAYAERNGVKVMIDLEHMSLDDEAPNWDTDARGWAKLQVINGELWATDVEWTPDGEKRLDNKTQRYISPAFARNPETKRVLKLFNIALVGQPATNAAQDLLAASRVSRFATKLEKPIETITLSLDMYGDSMPPELLEMLGLSPEATAEDLTAAVKALLGKVAASAAPPPASGDKPPGEEMAKLNATILALTERVKAGDVAIKELKAIKDKESLDKHSALIAKLPKNLEAWGQKQTVEVLEAYVAAATPVEVEIPPLPDTSKESFGTATEAEMAACKATGTPVQDFLKFKASKTQAA